MQAGSKRWLVVLGVCLGLGVSAGCSDDDSAGNNNTQTDAAVDAAPDAATGESVTFLVESWSVADATYLLAEGATVAFDAPGGVRTEATTGADGRLTFDGVDWSTGDAAVTVYKAGFVMYSVVNLDQDEYDTWAAENGGEYVLMLNSLTAETPTLVNVSGTATGLADVGHTYNVNTTNTMTMGTEWNGTGDQSYSIDVPSGESFVIQAVESELTTLPSGQGYNRPIYGVMHMDYGPITADATDVELDFDAHSMTTHTADVSVLMPPRTDSPLRSGPTPYCFVCDSNSAYCHGWPTYVDVVDNQNRIDLSFLWVEPAYVQGPLWFCQVQTSTGVFGRVNIPGTPQEGAQATLIDSPTWVTPANPAVASPLHDPLEWQWYEDVNTSIVGVFNGNDTVWLIMTGENGTTATIPEAPSVVDETAVVGSFPYLRVYGGTFGDLSLNPYNWVRLAQSESARVTP